MATGKSEGNPGKAKGTYRKFPFTDFTWSVYHRLTARPIQLPEALKILDVTFRATCEAGSLPARSQSIAHLSAECVIGAREFPVALRYHFRSKR